MVGNVWVVLGSGQGSFTKEAEFLVNFTLFYLYFYSGP